MIDNNLVLHLPFDDPDGSVAYDYSQSRADATLSNGAIFSKKAKVGKSIAFNGTGECETAKVIPFGSDFTLSCFVCPASKRLGWLLNLPGVDNYLEQWLNVVPGEWYFLAFVKQGSSFSVFQNTVQVYNGTFSGTPTGFSINDDSLNGTKALLDEVMLFKEAKSAKEIFQMQRDTDVEYYIDGRNFKEFGVYVSKSKGIVGQLERKEGLQVDWSNYHGIARDKKRKRYKERTISLDCFIEASSRSAYVEWVNLFFQQFEADGNHRLKIEYDGKAKPLVYEVEMHDGVDPDKQWGQYSDDVMVGTFTLKLVEDEPVKRVLRHIGTTANSVASISFSSYKMLNIYWGDGSHSYNVSGLNKTIEHTYTKPGEYDIIIAGVIEDITDFSTNDIVVWETLK